MHEIAAVSAALRAHQRPQCVEGRAAFLAGVLADGFGVFHQNGGARQSHAGEAHQRDRLAKTGERGDDDGERGARPDEPAALPQTPYGRRAASCKRAEAQQQHQRAKLRAGDPVEPRGAGLEGAPGEQLGEGRQYAAHEDGERERGEEHQRDEEQPIAGKQRL